MQRKASPPRMPPAIAPAWEDEDDAEDAVVEEAIGRGFCDLEIGDGEVDDDSVDAADEGTAGAKGPGSAAVAG